MKNKIMKALETFAKAMVQPLMYLSVAGIVLAIGALLTNSTITGMLPFLQWGPIQVVAKLMYETMMMIINNLGVLFVIGIPAALAKKDKHQAGLIGFISYLMYLKTSNILLSVTGNMATPNPMIGLYGTGQATILGIQVVDMSVFGGIVLGCLTGYVFNKTCNKQFKGAMTIYSGVRYSFFLMIIVSICFGFFGNYVWPFAQKGISALTLFIKNTGTFGLFIYGFLERLLIPTGLHHLVYTPFQFTDFGGVLQLGETTVVGAYPIAMTELNLPVAKLSESIYYNCLGFVKMFGYIGIGLAFIHTAKPENKARVKAMIIPLVITSVLATITEPLDFMFIFVAPLLYVVHSALAGLFIALLKIFNVTAFCGGNLIASTLLNLAAGVSKTNWPMMYVLGLIQIVVYFVVFTFLIKKFNFKTPGREDDTVDTSKDKEPAKAVDLKSDIASLVAGLGGKENILALENCFTRLRINVKDAEKINEELINKAPNSGIVKKGNDIQVIFGLQVPEVKSAVEDYLANC
ncbi:MAG: PTS transporter subunit EIIC [Erysipelotrichaceae bacterium]|nr:PTS transporter subunit EIIC [Erysipelotrichaceae bacterium]